MNYLLFILICIAFIFILLTKKAIINNKKLVEEEIAALKEENRQLLKKTEDIQGSLESLIQENQKMHEEQKKINGSVEDILSSQSARLDNGDVAIIQHENRLNEMRQDIISNRSLTDTFMSENQNLHEQEHLQIVEINTTLSRNEENDRLLKIENENNKAQINEITKNIDNMVNSLKSTEEDILLTLCEVNKVRDTINADKGSLEIEFSGRKRRN